MQSKTNALERLKNIRGSKAKAPCSRLLGMPMKLCFPWGKSIPAAWAKRSFLVTIPPHPLPRLPPSSCPSPAAPPCSPGIPRPAVQPHQALLGHGCWSTTRLGETNSHPGRRRALPGQPWGQHTARTQCPPPGHNERDTGQARACSEKGEQRTPGHTVSCYPAGTYGCPIWGC